MKAKIFSQHQLIGTTDLQVGDESMGHVFGEFTPTEEYFEKIQKSVWTFWQSNQADHQKWDSLRLNVQLENGVFLFPQGGFTIEDVKELPDEPKRIDVLGINCKIIQDYFLTDATRPFTDKPWNALSIGQKIAFEDELKLELGINEKSFYDIFKKTKRHILFDTDFSAFCHDQRNDDVLFEIRKPNFDKQYALVHLTWKCKKEVVEYLRTTFYQDFDEFKHSVMYVDSADWED